MVSAALLERARELAPALVQLRRRLHRCPELGLELPQTKKALLEALEGLPLEIAAHRGTSGFAATLRGARPGRTLLLRADMDALPLEEETGLDFRSQTPGAMHACGHDAHAAMLVGAARLLAAQREELAGQVRFMFQPGEEGYFGARHMIEEGVLDGDPPVQAAFALHIDPRIPVGFVATRPGALMASTDDFEIVLRGRGGHASMPHDADDPIPVACELVTAAQSWITRHIPAFDPVVLTVAHIQAGTTTNVIPERATLRGTLRAVSAGSRERAREGLRQLARGLAAAHGMSAAVELRSGYPGTFNDADFVRFAAQQLEPVLGAGRWIEMPNPIMGGEDFSYVLERVPGAMLFLGAGVAEGPREPCHSNRMQLNEDAIALGTALHAAMAFGFLGGFRNEGIDSLEAAQGSRRLPGS
jgi:amidohydrolase